MPTEKTQDAAGKEQVKSQDAKKTPVSKQQIKKAPQSGFLSALITWFIISFLSVLLIFLFAVIAVLFDFLGIIKIRDFLPRTVLENPYVKDYIRESTIIKSSEASKIKALIYEQESSYKDMADKLKHKEVAIEEQSVKLSLWEKELRERELEVISKEKTLVENIKKFEDAKKQKIVSDQTLDQFSKMYERMEPQLAADALVALEDGLLLDILSKMKEKRSALIMEKLPSDKVSKITTLIKQLSKIEPLAAGGAVENPAGVQNTSEAAIR